jgi:hypothetical protein
MAVQHDAAVALDRYTFWGGDDNDSMMRHSWIDGLCNTSQILCTRCQVNARPPKQRWCRQCLTASQRTRRAAQHTARSEMISAPVTQAAMQAMSYMTQAPVPGLPEAEQGPTDTVLPALFPQAGQAAKVSAGVTQAQGQALLAYRTAV